jgi:hypothetical protein
VRLLETGFPVADLRRALRAAGDEPVRIPDPEPRRLVVYRRDLRLWDLSLSPVAYAFLQALSGGASLGAAAEASATTPEAEAELASQLGSLLQEWTTKGLICDVQVD